VREPWRFVMKEAELENLLIEHFVLLKEQEASSGRAWLAKELPQELPPQWRGLPGLVPALLDWKFELAWPRLGILLGCAATGLLVGFFGPIHEGAEPHLTAIAYVMPAPDLLADSE